MSNPTTKVASFAGSLDGFTGVDPIHYDNGLLLESETTNLVRNPSGVAAANWSPSGNVTRVYNVDVPGPLPGWLGPLVSKCLRLDITGSVSAGSLLVVATVNTLTAAAHAIGAYLWVPSAVTATAMQVSAVNYTGASVTAGAVDMTKRDQWQLVSGAVTPAGGDLDGNLSVSTVTGALSSGQAVYLALAYVQLGPRTSPVQSTLGAGYSLVGGSDDGYHPSLRAASSASISPAGILAPDTGSLAFRFRRLIDTGGTETLLECGTAGSGTDYLSISVNSSDKLVVSWNSDNAGAQTVTSTESIAVDTEYFVYTEWASGTMGLSIDNGDLVVGARDAVEGDWGVGELVLEAT